MEKPLQGSIRGLPARLLNKNKYEKRNNSDFETNADGANTRTRVNVLMKSECRPVSRDKGP